MSEIMKGIPKLRPNDSQFMTEAMRAAMVPPGWRPVRERLADDRTIATLFRLDSKMAASVDLALMAGEAERHRAKIRKVQEQARAALSLDLERMRATGQWKSGRDYLAEMFPYPMNTSAETHRA